MLRYRPKDLARFLDKVGTTTVCTCWLWEGATIKSRGGNRYGQFHINWRPDNKREKVLAHRFSYEVFNGPIPVGLTVDHGCTRHLCVNPEHLTTLTNVENVREMLDRRGHPKQRTTSWICATCHANEGVKADTKQCTYCGAYWPNAEETLMPSRVDDDIPI